MLFGGRCWSGRCRRCFRHLTEKLDTAVYMASMEKLVELSGVRLILTTDDFAPVLLGSKVWLAK